MKSHAVCLCALLLASVVAAQEDEEATEKESPGPRKRAFQEPTYPSGDVYFVETFTNADKVWDRWEWRLKMTMFKLYVSLSRWVESEAKKDDGSARYNGTCIFTHPLTYKPFHASIVLYESTFLSPTCVCVSVCVCVCACVCRRVGAAEWGLGGSYRGRSLSRHTGEHIT